MRLIAATLLTLAVGLILTACFATLSIGRLNLISVAFAVLFLGLGVDFGIHLTLCFREALAAGRPVLVEVDLAGARAVRAAMPEAVLTFLAPPSWEVLVERLTGRGTESDEVVARRLETARTELAAQDEFDTVVVNDDVDRACDELVSLLVGPDAGPGPRS